LRHKHRAFEDVIELANISRETMLQQTFSRHLIETTNLLSITLCVLPKKAVRERDDVLSPFSQWR
jgi:hypothetical protein